MASISNSGSAVVTAESIGAELASARDQKSGYVGIDSNGDSGIIRNLKVEGKVGFNGAAPVGKPTAYTQTFGTSSRTHVEGEMSTTIVISLLTEVAAIMNAQNKCINELKKLANSLIDDLQANGLLQ
jgi:hypothetical protein